MIRNEKEYKESLVSLSEQKERLDEHRNRLKAVGMPDGDIENVVGPIETFRLRLQEEVGEYERSIRGQIDEVKNFSGFGRMLVSLRLAKGVSVRELADRLGTHVSQVSRDERNEYHGITIERAARVLDALGVRLTSKVDYSIG